jgi:hypothetical protein
MRSEVKMSGEKVQYKWRTKGENGESGQRQSKGENEKESVGMEEKII